MLRGRMMRAASNLPAQNSIDYSQFAPVLSLQFENAYQNANGDWFWNPFNDVSGTYGWNPFISGVAVDQANAYTGSGCAEFSNGNSVIRQYINSNLFLDLSPSSKFAIKVAYKPKTLNYYHVLLRFFRDSDGNVAQGIHIDFPSKKVVANFGSMHTNGILTSVSQLDIGSYYLIELIKNGTSAGLYINGVLEAQTNNLGGDEIPNPSRIIIGQDENGNYGCDGYMDDIVVYKGI